MGMKFNIKTKSGAEVDIPINNKVTIITGDSATGKTKMITYLADILKDRDEVLDTTVNLDSIILCKDTEDIKELLNKAEGSIKNMMIIIDKYDSLWEEEEKQLTEFINQSENLFIVCAHKPLKKCGYDYSSILELKHDGTNYNAIQLFEYPSDYLMKRDVLI